MKSKTVKIILTLLIIIGVVSLIQKFPDEMVLILGIGLVLIIGSWLMQLEKNEIN